MASQNPAPSSSFNTRSFPDRFIIVGELPNIEAPPRSRIRRGRLRILDSMSSRRGSSSTRSSSKKNSKNKNDKLEEDIAPLVESLVSEIIPKQLGFSSGCTEGNKKMGQKSGRNEPADNYPFIIKQGHSHRSKRFSL